MTEPINFLETTYTIDTRKQRVFRIIIATVSIISVLLISTVSTIWFMSVRKSESAPLLEVVMSLLRLPTLEPVDEIETIEPPINLLPEVCDEQNVTLPTTTAFAVLVLDEASDMVLGEKHSSDVWPLASITKLMSALVLLEQPMDWTTTTVVVGADSLDTLMYAGDTYTNEEIWNAMLIGSSNKAVLSLIFARGQTEPEFVARMNAKAVELGLPSLIFTDATGLSDANIGSANDVAKLLQEALLHEEISGVMKKTDMVLYSKERKKKREILSTNWLLLKGWIPNDLQVVGGKTGHTLAAAYNFTVSVKTKEGTRPLIVVILGSATPESRFTEARDVAVWAWDAYEWPE